MTASKCGTPAGFSQHRRDRTEPCPACREAERTYQREWARQHRTGQNQWVDATGTKRRLQALITAGYPMRWLGEWIGCPPGTMSTMVGPSKKVTIRNKERVEALYERLAYKTPHPTTTRSKAAVTRAKRVGEKRGWAPPLAWDNIDDPQERPKGRNVSGH